MKIIVISGSPRKTANTQVMMKYVYEYTKTKNEDTKLINLSDGDIESGVKALDSMNAIKEADDFSY